MRKKGGKKPGSKKSENIFHCFSQFFSFPRFFSEGREEACHIVPKKSNVLIKIVRWLETLTVDCF